MTAPTDHKPCGWGGCGNVADCGDRCRSCFTSVHARNVEALTLQPSDYLAEQVVVLEETRDYLASLSGAQSRFCRSMGCGHMQMVHTAAGCTGLRGTDDHWVACRCQGFTGVRP